jgi:hypothetical protein
MSSNISDFHNIIKAAALEFARANAIVTPGDIVLTQWGTWKKPHRVQISSVGAALAYGKFDREKGEYPAVLEMTYTALRLRANGDLRDKPGCGIALKGFITLEGVAWEQSRNVFNSALVCWDLPELWPSVPTEEVVE